MKIDIYAHICPKKFIDYFSEKVTSPERLKETDWPAGWPMLWDINKRLAIMDKYEDYAQVLVPTGPVPAVFRGPAEAAELARVFNDAMAEIVSKYPKKFVAAVAYLPLSDIEATLNEIDRAINKLGFKGICMDTPAYQLKQPDGVNYDYDYETVKPIDSPEFMPVYESMSKHSLPIWLHPRGKGALPVYQGEERGKYLCHWALGWPLESAMAVYRLVFGGILAKYPNLRFIIHHCGSGIIPVLAGRLDYPLDDNLKMRPLGEESPFTVKRPIEYFRMFYADTALGGDTAALMCGHAFFGAEHMLFGTDYPYDIEGGDKYIRNTISAVHRMNISDADKQRIFEGNARRILRLENLM